MDKLLILLGLIFGAFALFALAIPKSADAQAMLIGMLCGISAAIPVGIVLLVGSWSAAPARPHSPMIIESHRHRGDAYADHCDSARQIEAGHPTIES